MFGTKFQSEAMDNKPCVDPEEEKEEDEEEEEEEEALSLCDLPLNNDAEDSEGDRRSQPGQDLFEFFSNNIAITEMCPAEDIIVSGKLIPYREPLMDDTQKIKANETHYRNFSKKNNFQRSQSDSLAGSQRSRSDSARVPSMRGSRSLDYHKSKGSSSSMNSLAPSPSMNRKQSGKCSGSGDYSFRRESVLPSPAKSRWNPLMFGLVKVPPAMELKDIRNRQTRRSPSMLFPAPDGGETASVSKGERKGAWRLLRALSCKGHANVVVTASIHCISHA